MYISLSIVCSLFGDAALPWGNRFCRKLTRFFFTLFMHKLHTMHNVCRLRRNRKNNNQIDVFVSWHSANFEILCRCFSPLKFLVISSGENVYFISTFQNLGESESFFSLRALLLMMTSTLTHTYFAHYLNRLKSGFLLKFKNLSKYLQNLS